MFLTPHLMAFAVAGVAWVAFLRYLVIDWQAEMARRAARERGQ